MNPKRKQRLYLTLFLLLVASGVTALLIQISGENMNMFYPCGCSLRRGACWRNAPSGWHGAGGKRGTQCQ